MNSVRITIEHDDSTLDLMDKITSALQTIGVAVSIVESTRDTTMDILWGGIVSATGLSHTDGTTRVRGGE